MFDPTLLEDVDRVSEQYISIHDEIERIWAQQMLFKWHWWLDVALAVLPWIIWIIVRDRKNTHSLLYAGIFAAFIATILNMAGVSQGGWNYNTWLLPYFPEYLPWDWTIMPVTVMMFYQFWPRITARVSRAWRFLRSPWIAALAFGAIAAYVAEPVFAWLGMYEPSGWEQHYSLLIYYTIFMIGWLLYTKKSCRAHAAAKG